MHALKELQTAVLAARARGAEPFVGTQVNKGRMDIVRAVPPMSGRGRYAVTVLRAGLSLPEAVAFVSAL